MEHYLIHITSEINKEKLEKGIYIFIYRATRIPPHIGLIVNGGLYDITSVGPSIKLSIADFYKTALKRKTEILFIELTDTNHALDLNNLAKEKVSEYWKATYEISCLNPVKDFLNDAYKIETNHTQFIFELLPLLNELNMVVGISQINLDDKLQNNVYELKKYTKKDIENCIESLQRKENSFC